MKFNLLLAELIVKKSQESQAKKQSKKALAPYKQLLLRIRSFVGFLKANQPSYLDLR